MIEKGIEKYCHERGSSSEEIVKEYLAPLEDLFDGEFEQVCKNISTF